MGGGYGSRGVLGAGFGPEEREEREMRVPGGGLTPRRAVKCLLSGSSRGRVDGVGFDTFLADQLPVRVQPALPDESSTHSGARS